MSLESLRANSRERGSKLPSLNDLVGAGDQCWRQIETDGARSLHVDDQLKPVQLLDRELGRISALEDPIHMRCRATPGHPTVETVGHEKAVTGHETEPGGRRQTSLDRKGRNSSPLRRDRWGCVNVQSLYSLADNGRESLVQIRRPGYGDRHHDQPKMQCHLLLLDLEGGKGGNIFRTVDDAEALNSGVDLLEQLQVLFVYGFQLVHDAGDVATRPCQRFNEAQAHRHVRTGHDDGYSRGLAPRRIERLRVAHHNDIDLEGTEFC